MKYIINRIKNNYIIIIKTIIIITLVINIMQSYQM